MRQRLICTVGTSLLSNLRRMTEHDNIKEALDKKNWQLISQHLFQLGNTNKICGAEINSITSICRKGFLSAYTELTFLVSDTPEGESTGQILKLYYENSKNPIRFDKVEVEQLEGLNGKNFRDFRLKGLKNLVKAISQKARHYTPETLAINSTGGYKAQISFAGIIGQALDIPVYYMFEEFDEVIALPAQPVSLDLTFWFEHYAFFEQLAQAEYDAVGKSDLDDPYEGEYYDALVEEVEINGKPYITLTPTGQLFHERCDYNFRKDESVILEHLPKDLTDPKKKKIKIGDQHGKDELKALAEKLCQSPFVVEVVNSLPYNSELSNPIRKIKDDGKIELVMTKTDAGYGLCVQTTGRNKKETGAIARILVEKYL
jgi:putative CRISPR-associated protein (TIGR02619 family)